MIPAPRTLSLLESSHALSNYLWQRATSHHISVFQSQNTNLPYRPADSTTEKVLGSSYKAISYQDDLIIPDGPYLCPQTVVAHLALSIVREIWGETITPEAIKQYLDETREGAGILAALKGLGLGIAAFDDVDKAQPGDVCLITHENDQGDHFDTYAGVVAERSQVLLSGSDYKRGYLWLWGALWNARGTGFDYWARTKTREYNGAFYERRFSFLRPL